jgi:hypothetical protein
MKQLRHTNVVKIKHYFYQNGDKEDEVYLNLVLEYVPDTVYKVVRNYTKAKAAVPMMIVKVRRCCGGDEAAGRSSARKRIRTVFADPPPIAHASPSPPFCRASTTPRHTRAHAPTNKPRLGLDA